MSGSIMGLACVSGSICTSLCLLRRVSGSGVSMCEGGEGGEWLKWFNMHVIVFVTSRAFK